MMGVGLVLRFLVVCAALAGILFGCAGRLDLPFFWAYLGFVAGFALVARFVLDPGLLRERLRPAPGGHDRLLRLFLFPFVLGGLVVAGLDVGRYHWSPAMPVAVQVAGFIGMALGLGWVAWSMHVNRFFSPVVRIQTERGHHLVQSGPYRFVRHPGYIGMIVAIASSAVALGSWWALVPALGYAVLILRRTATEDRFLQANLEGYAKYAEQVRYRLIPGVW